MMPWLRTPLRVLAWSSIVLVAIQWGLMTVRQLAGEVTDGLGWGQGLDIWLPHIAQLTIFLIPGSILLVALSIERTLSERGA